MDSPPLLAKHLGLNLTFMNPCIVIQLRK